MILGEQIAEKSNRWIVIKKGSLWNRGSQFDFGSLNNKQCCRITSETAIPQAINHS